MEIGMDMDSEMGIDFYVVYVGNTHMRFMIACILLFQSNR